jgi:hypothetical protein
MTVLKTIINQLIPEAMKSKCFIFLSIISILLSLDVKAQKVVLVSGDLAKLKNEKTLNVVLKYENLKSGMEGYPDSVYKQKKVKDLNDKEPGKGDKWLAHWNENIKDFAPCFLEGFNKDLNKYGVKALLNEPNSTYTVILQTDQMFESAWDGGHIIAKMYIVPSSDYSDKIAYLDFGNIRTIRGSKITQAWIAGAFFNTGKVAGKYFKNNIYKKK